MIDSLTSENHRDFGARYKGTWGYYISDLNGKTLVKVVNVSHEEVLFCDIEGNTYKGFVDKGMLFDFIPVNKGYFNAPECVYWFERVAARQWQRGISLNNTAVSIFNGDIFQVAKLETAINAVFNPKNHIASVKDSWEAYKNNSKYAVALSKHFAIGAYKVYFYKQPIGNIKGNVIFLDNDIVVQELNDSIVRNALNIKVVV